MANTKKKTQILKGNTKYRTKKQNDNQNDKNYYLIKSMYFNDNIINNSFKIRNNWEQYNINKPQKASPDFLYLDGNYILNKNYWKYKPFLQNKFDAPSSNLTTKDKLYKTLNDNKGKYPILSKYMINNINIDFKEFISSNNKINYSKIDKFQKYFSNTDNNLDNKEKSKQWIFKPVGGFQGKGIVAVSDFKTFKKKCEDILKFLIKDGDKLVKKNTRKEYQLPKLYNRWVLQEYIDKTLLYPNITSGKKIHLRVYFLYFNDIINNKVYGYILDTCHLGMAKEKYKHNDYTNKDIHDTHLGKNKKGLTFPHDFKKIVAPGQIKNIFQQLKELFRILKELFQSSCYPGIKNCYEILGADIIILPDYSIKLIELNSNLNIINNALEKANTHQKLFNGLMSLVVDKVFPPLNKDLKKIKLLPNHFIEI